MKQTRLIDKVIKEAFRERCIPKSFYEPLRKAAAFVIEDDAAHFLASLANLTFKEKSTAQRIAIIDAWIDQAQGPFDVTWFEYPCRVYQKALDEINMRAAAKDAPLPIEWCGWMIVKQDTAHFVYIFADMSDFVAMIPMRLYWDTKHETPVSAHYYSDPLLGNAFVKQVDTEELRKMQDHYAGVSMGIPDIPRPARFLAHFFHEQDNEHALKMALVLSNEFGGEARRILAALVMLHASKQQHDTAKEISMNRVASAGSQMVTGGKIVKLSNYTSVRVTAPREQHALLARRIVRYVKRCSHPVRGHWRINWRKPEEKVWVRDHKRGDPALGVKEFGEYVMK